jgi:hypothetical protein
MRTNEEEGGGSTGIVVWERGLGGRGNNTGEGGRGGRRKRGGKEDGYERRGDKGRQRKKDTPKQRLSALKITESGISV